MRGRGWGQHWSGGHRDAPWGPPMMWGRGFHGYGPPGFARGPRARRGDVRAAILDVLAEQPMNGYQIIQRIAERSDGLWKPSPGSVYPTVQQLEDEGLVEAHESDGRRLLRLSEQGRAYVEDNAEELASTWRGFDEPAGEDSAELKPMIGQVLAACWQIAMTGTVQQQTQAGEVLAETRRKLYGLLAEGDPG